MELAGLEQLAEQYGGVLYAFCNQLTGSRQEGEELYQETFLKAVELHRQIDAVQNPKGFLVAVAARLWRNRRRKYAWRQRIAPMGQWDEQEEQQPTQTYCNNPEELALQLEQRRLVRQAVSELPDKWKLPVYMYYTVGLSIEEIASLLRIPTGTVKSRLYKAREVLKEKFEVSWNEK